MIDLNDIKYFFGPMSKNIVDVFMERGDVGLIPSRRQVDVGGGYANGWTQTSLRRYVGDDIIIERDHGGPHQGSALDDGTESFMHDSTNFNILHIDPWKAYPDLDAGIAVSCQHMKSCHSRNSNVLFEVGTEQAIREFSVRDLEYIDDAFKTMLLPKVYERIKYFVIQSGVGLDVVNRKNTGTFDIERLRSMISFCKERGVLSKEHNGDYLSKDEISLRFKEGLDAINIAPEVGQLETDILVKLIDTHCLEEIDTLFSVCLKSKKWEKWVGVDFDPEADKLKLIGVCGHYVFSSKEVIDIKKKITNVCGEDIDNIIKLGLRKEFEKYE